MCMCVCDTVCICACLWVQVNDRPGKGFEWLLEKHLLPTEGSSDA